MQQAGGEKSVPATTTAACTADTDEEKRGEQTHSTASNCVCAIWEHDDDEESISNLRCLDSVVGCAQLYSVELY
jgi:hypothetical protein